MYVRFYFFTSYTTRALSLTFENEMINDRRSSTGRERVGLFASKTIVSPAPPKTTPVSRVPSVQRRGPRGESCWNFEWKTTIRFLVADPVLFGRETGLIRITLIKPFLKGFPICVERQLSCPVIRFRNMRAFAFRLTKKRIFVIKRTFASSTNDGSLEQRKFRKYYVSFDHHHQFPKAVIAASCLGGVAPHYLRIGKK